MSKLLMPFVLVPQQNVMIIERFGRFVRTVQPGLQFKIPFAEAVAYHHSLKEQVLDIDSQTAITKDNVKIKIDGVLYFKITDPVKASYNVAQPIRAISLLAQTSMRSEIGLLDLDRTFEERDNLNINIKRSLNNASQKWGIDCMRYEIKDIKPPEQIKRSMELQAESERIKRSKILNSEGERQSKINIAEGFKQSQILEGEGAAEKIKQEARSVVESLQNIAKALENGTGGIHEQALKMRLAEKYIAALNETYSTAKIVVLPPTTNSSGMSPASIATALTLFGQLSGQRITDSSRQNDHTSEAMEKVLSSLKNLSENGRKEAINKVKFLDDKALYQ